MPGLHAERCQACNTDTPTLGAEEARQLARELDGAWVLEEARLRRRFEFSNFASAFALATRVALIAEREGHHPELRVGWGYCEVESTTHVAGGLTRNDFILAARIDRAASSPLGGRGQTVP
ncbi:MAG: 4a-hydroxytetrahydrobiopterin dehydratase [Candidatus Dormibacteria bacterium]